MKRYEIFFLSIFVEIILGMVRVCDRLSGCVFLQRQHPPSPRLEAPKAPFGASIHSFVRLCR